MWNHKNYHKSCDKKITTYILICVLYNILKQKSTEAKTNKIITVFLYLCTLILYLCIWISYTDWISWTCTFINKTRTINREAKINKKNANVQNVNERNIKKHKNVAIKVKNTAAIKNQRCRRKLLTLTAWREA